MRPVQVIKQPYVHVSLLETRWGGGLVASAAPLALKFSWCGDVKTVRCPGKNDVVVGDSRATALPALVLWLGSSFEFQI